MSTPSHRPEPPGGDFFSRHRRRAFTLVELLIGMSLALFLMLAILSSFVFLGKNFTRTLGIGVSSQPTLESQARRTIEMFVQDVQSTSAISSPSASDITLTVPSDKGGTKNVTYYYNSTSAAVTPYTGVTIAANSLARVDRSNSTFRLIHTNLLSCTFSYYDSSGYPYTAYVNYLAGIKQISMTLTAQAGSSTNNTLTDVYSLSSPRLMLHNKSMLP
ncbi:MAG: hypothetical protein JWM35_788 [Verrucomicrobia bacterium]|nr:hypothetical protein [Verrucomicrobiota bacterium]